MSNHIKYHLMYKNISKDTIMAVRAIVKEGLFKKKGDERFALLSKLHTLLCSQYQVTGLLKKGKIDQYLIPTNTIFINDEKLSLISYLHEFKHLLQFQKNKPNSEKIACGWSLSLYYLATPKLFNKALEKGLIIHQKGIENGENNEDNCK